MSNIEKLKEEGLDFLNLMLIPISVQDYLYHKNQVDMYIREFKEKYGEKVDRWGWEMKTIFPETSITTNGSLELLRIFSSEVLTITHGDLDNVLQVFSPGIFSFRLDRVQDVNQYIWETVTDLKQIPLLEKLTASDFSDEIKVLFNSLINPELFFSQVFPNNQFNALTEQTYDALANYVVRIKDDNDSMLKLFTMGNALLAGLSVDNIEDVRKMIEESTDEDGKYDSVVAMGKVNKYFEKQKGK